MAEDPSDIELDECSVEVSYVNEDEALDYTHGEVSYYTVAATESDCPLELMVDGVELSTTSEQCEEDLSKDGITILTADGRFLTDGIGQLIQCDVDGTDAAAAAAVNARHLVLNLAHPMGKSSVAFHHSLEHASRQHIWITIKHNNTYKVL